MLGAHNAGDVGMIVGAFEKMLTMFTEETVLP